jgi:hypothetical protein
MTKKPYDEFIEDLEKDIRAENLKKIWSRFGKVITSGAIFLTLSVAAYMIWQKNLEHENKEQAIQFLKAQNLIAQGSAEQAIFCLKDLAEKTTSYGIFAKLTLAAQDQKNALAVYKEIFSQENSVFFKDLARVLYVTYAIDKKENLDNLKEILQPALKGPWDLIASDLYGFMLYKQNKFKEALSYFSKIAKEPKCPQDLKFRAQIFSQECIQRAG